MLTKYAQGLYSEVYCILTDVFAYKVTKDALSSPVDVKASYFIHWTNETCRKKVEMHCNLSIGDGDIRRLVAKEGLGALRLQLILRTVLRMQKR